MTTSIHGPYVIGIDLGGTKILAGVVDSSHRIVGRSKRSTPAGQGEGVLLEAIVECAREAQLAAMVDTSDIACVGVGAPGTLDLENGLIRVAPNLGVRDFPLGQRLSVALGLPTLLRNDVRAAGFGELRLGTGRGYRDILAVFVGTGIGGCVIQDGHVRHGATGNAGEIGHIIAKVGGPRCGCGAKGCLEALASRTAITKRLQKAIKRGVSSSLASTLNSKNARLKSKELATAFRNRDDLARREVERAARALGLALGGLVNLYAPQLIILGGGVTEALGDPYLDLVRRWTRKQAITDPEHHVLVERAALGDDAGLLGASLLAREHFFQPSNGDRLTTVAVASEL